MIIRVFLEINHIVNILHGQLQGMINFIGTDWCLLIFFYQNTRINHPKSVQLDFNSQRKTTNLLKHSSKWKFLLSDFRKKNLIINLEFSLIWGFYKMICFFLIYSSISCFFLLFLNFFYITGLLSTQLSLVTNGLNLYTTRQHITE